MSKSHLSSNHKTVKNIIFIGFPKSGKTVVGKEASKALNIPWYDLDQILMDDYHTHTHTHLTCKEIWEKKGETFFRKIETRSFEQFVSEQTDAQETYALSLGGGAPLNKSIFNYLKQCHAHTEVVYLKVDPSIIYERMQQTHFPKFLDPKDPVQSLNFHYQKRDVMYSAVASTVLDIHDSHVGNMVSYVTDALSSILMQKTKRMHHES